MIRFLVAILFLFVSLFASDNETILKRANEYMQSKEQSDVFRAYNDYKNLYIRSTIENDLDLKAESLRGIVESGNILHIDVSNYAIELEKTKPQDKPKKSDKKQAVQIQPLHKLQSVKWDKEKLILKFDKPISNEQVEALTLHESAKRRYRYIFDINSAMMTSSHNISKHGIDAIKLAQYSPQSLRLVIENSSEIEVKWSFENVFVFIMFKPDVEKTTQTAAVKPSVEKAVDKDKIIVLDPGHGGDDPGAISNGYREKDIVFSVASELNKILKSRGYRVYMTRDSDVFVKLSQRTKFANDKNAHIFVSIHANAVDGKNKSDINGIESFFLSPSRSERAKRVAAKENSADISEMNIYGKDSYLNLLNHHNILASNKLAIDLQRGMLGAVNQKYKGVNDNGVKEGPFWVLVGAQMPSVLVEVGFLTNQTEANRLSDAGYRKALSYGLADGIERYFANCQ